LQKSNQIFAFFRRENESEGEKEFELDIDGANAPTCLKQVTRFARPSIGSLRIEKAAAIATPTGKETSSRAGDDRDDYGLSKHTRGLTQSATQRPDDTAQDVKVTMSRR